MSRHFVREIDRLNKNIVEFGNRVENQVRLAILSIRNNDIDLAKKVIKADNAKSIVR